jgi:hypothetical protein
MPKTLSSEAAVTSRQKSLLLWALLAGAMILVVVVVVVTSTDSTNPTPTGSTATPDADTPASESSPALAKLDTLPIKGRAPKTGYDRKLFGLAWSDDVTVPDGHNGCDTRDDILRRDLTDVEFKPGTHRCVVVSGMLDDPYTGTTIDFHRGRGMSREVQIDHIVALSDAWQKGAQQWDEATRRNFANDPANLQTTAGWVNDDKDDADAASWLPPNKSYRCIYVTRIVNVKTRYGLWVTQAEHDAIAHSLSSGCTIPRAPADEGPSVYYPNCAAARAAGAAPIHVGQEGYRPALDRNGNGIACER